MLSQLTGTFNNQVIQITGGSRRSQPQYDRSAPEETGRAGILVAVGKSRGARYTVKKRN